MTLYDVTAGPTWKIDEGQEVRDAIWSVLNAGKPDKWGVKGFFLHAIRETLISLIAAHARAGIDITSDAYAGAIEKMWASAKMMYSK